MLAALFLICVTAKPQSLPIDRLVAIVDARYNSLTTLRANFLEIYTEGNEARTESGVLYLQKPGRMRWDYLQPQHKLFLVDGRNAWVYIDGDQQAERTSLKTFSDLRTPLRFLLGHTNLRRELADLSYGGLDPLQPGDVVMRGVPRFLSDQFSEMLLEITPAYDITRIVIRARDGSQTEIRLSNIEANRRLPAGLFRFTPPPGVRVVTGDAAAPAGS
jgi:outer membrane lipoprotein carrier protein